MPLQRKLPRRGTETFKGYMNYRKAFLNVEIMNKLLKCRLFKNLQDYIRFKIFDVKEIKKDIFTV